MLEGVRQTKGVGEERFYVDERCSSANGQDARQHGYWKMQLHPRVAAFRLDIKNLGVRKEGKWERGR
jgi:hypothetical protein